MIRFYPVFYKHVILVDISSWFSHRQSNKWMNYSQNPLKLCLSQYTNKGHLVSNASNGLYHSTASWHQYSHLHESTQNWELNVYIYIYIYHPTRLTLSQYNINQWVEYCLFYRILDIAKRCPGEVFHLIISLKYSYITKTLTLLFNG